VRGFTLLELLVVLVILGMAAALVAPPLARTVDRVREAGDRDDVQRALERLPLLARDRGVAIELDAGVEVPSPGGPWPAGWRVVAVSPLRVEANGFCSGGAVQASGPAGTRRWRLSAPGCAVEDADAP
jgi:prepilin-type N-terminal cleavage/methylation domain-containing protein